MNKFFKIFFFLISSTICFSQINSIKVEYAVTIGENLEYQKNEVIKTYYDNAISGSESLNFSLYSNLKETTFQLVDKIDNNPFSAMFSGYKGEFFYENNSDFFYQSVNDNIIGSYIIEGKRIYKNWKYFEESKIIDGHLCFKAENEESVTNEKGNFIYKIIAWYCPSINISIGPLSYGGLPGLILELNRRNVVFGASKIIINPSSKNLIIKPNIENKKTEEEILKIKIDYIESLKKLYNK